ncbi:MAG: hypothetical protein IT441_08865 [Phycisphaeraceae bacterium]|nr:hypothetical protein [Phycisphaeraceae bacterium]
MSFQEIHQDQAKSNESPFVSLGDPLARSLNRLGKIGKYPPGVMALGERKKREPQVMLGPKPYCNNQATNRFQHWAGQKKPLASGA